jgi:hypothetical protein
MNGTAKHPNPCQIAQSNLVPLAGFIYKVDHEHQTGSTDSTAPSGSYPSEGPVFRGGGKRDGKGVREEKGTADRIVKLEPGQADADIGLKANVNTGMYSATLSLRCKTNQQWTSGLPRSRLWRKR